MEFLGIPVLENHTEPESSKYLIFYFLFDIGCVQLQNLSSILDP